MSRPAVRHVIAVVVIAVLGSSSTFAPPVAQGADDATDQRVLRELGFVPSYYEVVSFNDAFLDDVIHRGMNCCPIPLTLGDKEYLLNLELDSRYLGAEPTSMVAFGGDVIGQVGSRAYLAVTRNMSSIIGAVMLPPNALANETTWTDWSIRPLNLSTGGPEHVVYRGSSPVPPHKPLAENVTLRRAGEATLHRVAWANPVVEDCIGAGYTGSGHVSLSVAPLNDTHKNVFVSALASCPEVANHTVAYAYSVAAVALPNGSFAAESLNACGGFRAWKGGADYWNVSVDAENVSGCERVDATVRAAAGPGAATAYEPPEEATDPGEDPAPDRNARCDRKDECQALQNADGSWSTRSVGYVVARGPACSMQNRPCDDLAYPWLETTSVVTYWLSRELPIKFFIVHARTNGITDPGTGNKYCADWTAFEKAYYRMPGYSVNYGDYYVIFKHGISSGVEGDSPWPDTVGGCATFYRAYPQEYIFSLGRPTNRHTIYHEFGHTLNLTHRNLPSAQEPLHCHNEIIWEGAETCSQTTTNMFMSGHQPCYQAAVCYANSWDHLSAMCCDIVTYAWPYSPQEGVTMNDRYVPPGHSTPIRQYEPKFRYDPDEKVKAGLTEVTHDYKEDLWRGEVRASNFRLTSMSAILSKTPARAWSPVNFGAHGEFSVDIRWTPDCNEYNQCHKAKGALLKVTKDASSTPKEAIKYIDPKATPNDPASTNHVINCYTSFWANGGGQLTVDPTCPMRFQGAGTYKVEVGYLHETKNTKHWFPLTYTVVVA